MNYVQISLQTYALKFSSVVFARAGIYYFKTVNAFLSKGSLTLFFFDFTYAYIYIYMYVTHL